MIGSVALLLTLLSEASASGSWIAIVGMPELGVLAASELGIALARLALVPRPGIQIANVVGALLDGVDIVVVAASADVRRLPALARRLSSRARHRGAVLVSFGAWPVATDLELTADSSHWTGIGRENGCLVHRTATVMVRGRGGAVRPTRERASLLGHGVSQESTWQAGDPSRDNCVDRSDG